MRSIILSSMKQSLAAQKLAIWQNNCFWSHPNCMQAWLQHLQLNNYHNPESKKLTAIALVCWALDWDRQMPQALACCVCITTEPIPECSVREMPQTNFDTAHMAAYGLHKLCLLPFVSMTKQFWKVFTLFFESLISCFSCETSVTAFLADCLKFWPVSGNRALC